MRANDPWPSSADQFIIINAETNENALISCMVLYPNYTIISRLSSYVLFVNFMLLEKALNLSLWLITESWRRGSSFLPPAVAAAAVAAAPTTSRPTQPWRPRSATLETGKEMPKTDFSLMDFLLTVFINPCRDSNIYLEVVDSDETVVLPGQARLAAFEGEEVLLTARTNEEPDKWANFMLRV